MAYLTTFRIEGDSDELLRFKREKMDPTVEPAARENGIIEHVVARTDSGLMIVNLWETLEGAERTSEVARQAALDAGEEARPPQDWQSYEVVQREVVQAG